MPRWTMADQREYDARRRAETIKNRNAYLKFHAPDTSIPEPHDYGRCQDFIYKSCILCEHYWAGYYRGRSVGQRWAAPDGVSDTDDTYDT